MRTSMFVIAVIACVLSAPVTSAQEPAVPARQAMGMDMDKQMTQMQENMKTMQQQMERLRTTTDPKERQKLMEEHMQTMQKNMTAMRSMGGPTMNMMGGKSGSMMNMEPKQREEHMQRRMDMMQMMMEQMMQHEQMKEPAPAK